LYVDDCLAIHHDAEGALLQIDKFFPMKAGSIGDPDIYLGSKLHKCGKASTIYIICMENQLFPQHTSVLSHQMLTYFKMPDYSLSDHEDAGLSGI